MPPKLAILSIITCIALTVFVICVITCFFLPSTNIITTSNPQVSNPLIWANPLDSREIVEKSKRVYEWRSSGLQVESQDNHDSKTKNIELTIVIIGLAKRKKTHYQVLAKKLNKYGLVANYFEAFDGKKINPSDFDAELTSSYKQWFLDKYQELIAKKTEADYRGHIGCAITFRTCYKNIQDMTLILEDDADPVPDFKNKLTTAIEDVYKLDPEWDVLVLGCCCAYNHHFYCKENDSEPIEKGGLIRLHYWLGGWAIVIKNRETAQKILGLITPQTWHVDLVLSGLAREGRIRAYGMMPTICNHPGRLRISSHDFWQEGDGSLYRTDTNS